MGVPGVGVAGGMRARDSRQAVKPEKLHLQGWCSLLGAREGRNTGTTIALANIAALVAA